MQCGPLASRETTATSHGRARYAAATHPHGSPSSASSSKTVPVGLTELVVTAWTAISPSRASPRQPPARLTTADPYCNLGTSYLVRQVLGRFGSPLQGTFVPSTSS